MAVLSAGELKESDVYRAPSSLAPSLSVASHAEPKSAAGHFPGNFEPGLDYRRQPVYARPRGSMDSGYRLFDTWPRIGEAI
jgi:hypothetical protein